MLQARLYYQLFSLNALLIFRTLFSHRASPYFSNPFQKGYHLLEEYIYKFSLPLAHYDTKLVDITDFQASHLMPLNLHLQYLSMTDDSSIFAANGFGLC